MFVILAAGLTQYIRLGRARDQRGNMLLTTQPCMRQNRIITNVMSQMAMRHAGSVSCTIKRTVYAGEGGGRRLESPQS